MEFADSGDMYQQVQLFRQKGQFMSEKFIWKVVVQLVSGLKALHDFEILHRDLKSANVFLYKSGLTKLGDMNVSKVAKAGMRYTQTGTPFYASPEVWQDEEYDFKSDMWSLGCVIYEIAALHPPFQASDMDGLYRKVTTGRFSRLPRVYSRELNTLVGMLLQRKPSDRPNCAQVLSLPFVIHKSRHSKARPSVKETNLLGTIYMPKELYQLPEFLPEPNYTDRSERAEAQIAKTTREKVSKSVLSRGKLNLTPTLTRRPKDCSESPGPARRSRKFLRENFGALKLPRVLYPSSRQPSVKQFGSSVSRSVVSKIGDIVRRMKIARSSLRRGDSQIY
jgi:NIMA (never in mitosis gene a)-related kinase